MDVQTGEMSAGSWIYIGSQGIVQGTYETFVELGRQHYGGDLFGRWFLIAGLGGMEEPNHWPRRWRGRPVLQSNASSARSTCDCEQGLNLPGITGE